MTRRGGLGRFSPMLWVLPWGLGVSSAQAQGDGVDPHESKRAVAPLERRPTLGTTTLFSRDWTRGEPRWFFGAEAEAGYLFFRPKGMVGYGRPHFSWGGLEAEPLFLLGSLGGFAGARLRLPQTTIRTGALLVRSLRHSYLEPATHFDIHDLESEAVDERAEYYAWETTGIASTGWGPTGWELEFGYLHVEGVPEGKLVFVERWGVIAPGPRLGRARLTWTWPVPLFRRMFLGPSAEAVLVQGRQEPLVVRAGFVASWILYRDVEVQVETLPTWAGPDTLGRAASPWLTFTLKLFWATGGP